MSARAAALAALAVLALGADAARVPRVERVVPHPRPVAQAGLDEDEAVSDAARLHAWLEQTHVAPRGASWRALDAQSRAQLAPQRAAQRTFVRKALGAVAGTWSERGSYDQAGRVIATAYDPAIDTLYAYAHGGTVWTRPRTASWWRVLNDHHSVRPYYLQGAMKLLARPDGGKRILLAAAAPNSVSYSDDRGATWTRASGITDADTYDIEQLAVRGDGSGDVYLTLATNAGRSRLFASSDRGATFTARVTFAAERPVGLFAPPERSGEVYLLVDADLLRIDRTSQQIVSVSTLPVDFDPADAFRTLLSGGVTPEGQPFLYAFYRVRGSQDVRVFRSLDGGMTWTQRTPMPSRLFTRQSIASSARDPNVVIGGEIDAYRTGDGGATWQQVNSWVDYYGDPATKLHADIDDVSPYVDRDGREHFLISTDGGVYDTIDGGATVSNQSLSGLRNSEYYGTYTVRTGAGAIIAGAQDQGWQKSIDGRGSFVQAISGDYANLRSGDGGASVWGVYPGFVLHDPNPSSAQSDLRSWDFESNGVDSHQFLPPIAIAGADPNTIWLGGTSTGASPAEYRHYIFELHAGPNLEITGRQLPFDFGSDVSAMATDPFVPARRYAMTINRELFRSEDAGATWARTAGDTPFLARYYSTLLPDPVRAGRLYLAGSGYGSVAAVVVSDDGGTTLAPLAAGLPNTYVYDLAISHDGMHLFAATELGAFYYDRARGAWLDITVGAPEQAYWSVEFIEATRTARFATYGRGVWDFKLL